MDKKIKNKKRKELHGRSYIFWGVIAAIVLVLITLFIIKSCQIKDINSYTKVESVVGSEIYKQEEETYFVLFYDFNNREEMETFDKTMYKFLTYRRDKGEKNGAYKLYKADSDDYVNKECIQSKTVITNTTTFPNPVDGATGDAILQISSSDLPVLLIVTGGVVTDYKAGEANILTYINNIIK